MSWTRHQLDGDRAAGLLHELCPLGEGETPTVIGYRDARGNLRRVIADYPNGWQLTAHFSLPDTGPDGAEVSISSWSARLRLQTPTFGASQ